MFVSKEGLAALAMAGACLAGAAPAPAQDFYAGRNIEMIVGYAPGGSNDLYARLVAQFIGEHIPGRPRVLVQNMPGGGSLVAANFVYNVAPKDGTVLAAVSQGIPLQARLGHPQARFDPAKFNWIGRTAASANVTMVWQTSSARSFADALKQEISLGATGAGSTVALYPSVMNEILKTKFKLILGYKGSPEAMLAMSRGEVEGHSTTWEAVKAVNPDWVKDGKVRILVQHGLRRHADLPDVPTSVELAKDPADRAIMEVIMSAAEVGKSYFTSPAVPPERVAILRRAFDAMVKDDGFIAATRKIGGDVDPMRGEEVQAMIADLNKLSPDLIARVKSVYNEQ